MPRYPSRTDPGESVVTVTWGRLKQMLAGMPDDWELWPDLKSGRLFVEAPGGAHGDTPDVPCGYVTLGADAFLWFEGHEGDWRVDDAGRGGP